MSAEEKNRYEMRIDDDRLRRRNTRLRKAGECLATLAVAYGMGQYIIARNGECIKSLQAEQTQTIIVTPGREEKNAPFEGYNRITMKGEEFIVDVPCTQNECETLLREAQAMWNLAAARGEQATIDAKISSTACCRMSVERVHTSYGVVDFMKR